MTTSKTVHCSACGKPMKTLRGGFVGKAPIVCRECFGKSSYGGRSGHWNISHVSSGSGDSSE